MLSLHQSGATISAIHWMFTFGKPAVLTHWDLLHFQNCRLVKCKSLVLLAFSVNFPWRFYWWLCARVIWLSVLKVELPGPPTHQLFWLGKPAVLLHSCQKSLSALNTKKQNKHHCHKQSASVLINTRRPNMKGHSRNIYWHRCSCANKCFHLGGGGDRGRQTDVLGWCLSVLINL